MLHRNHLLQAASGLILAATLAAQTITVPNGTGTVEGNSSGTFPWSSTSTTIAGLRVQHLYDGSNFINQGVTTPVYINRIRWRANAAAATTTWVGGTYANATIKLSTSPLDYAAVSDQFANNEGSNVVVGYSGPVSFLPGSGNGTGVIGQTVVDITLTTPFLYNPNQGDLNIDADHLLGANFTPNQPTGTNRVSVDIQTTGALASRCYASGNYPNTSGPGALSQTVPHGIVVTLDYTPAVGLFSAFSALGTRSGPSPFTVQFNDTSTSSAPSGVTSWAWDFDGDGIVDSTLPNPVFTYTTCGAFDVTLTVQDGVNPPATLTRTGYIRTDDIVADFTSTAISPNVYQLTDTSTPPATSWAWDFDSDGIVDSTVQNPVIALTLCQSSQVTLTATRNCRSSSKLRSFYFAQNNLATPFVAAGGTGVNGFGSGALVFSDLNVTNPAGITVCAVGVNTSTTAVGTPFTTNIYLTESSYVGKDNDISKWRLSGTGTSYTGGDGVVTQCALLRPMHLPQGTYGMAMQVVGSSVRYTGTTTTFPQLTVSNADLSLTTGAVRTTLFNGGSYFTVRHWNGVLYYDTTAINTSAYYGFFGTGCAGSLPTGRQTITSAPRVGGSLSLSFDNLPSSLTLVMLGFSNTNAPGFGPLPIDLTGIGMTGCTARVSPDLTFFTLGASNSASLLLSIPNDPFFVGTPIYTQALTPDAAGNLFGWVLSDAAGGPMGF